MKKTKILIMLMILLSGIIILGTNVQAVTDDETTKDTQTGETKKETTEDTDTEDDSEPGDDTDSTELTWTDVSKMKVETVKDGENHDFNVYAEISGITEKPESTYLYYITKTKNEPDTTKEDEGIRVKNEKVRCLINNEMELAGDTYLWIYERPRDEEQGKFIVSAYKLERINYNLGEKLSAFFFSSKYDEPTSTFLWTSHDEDNKRNIKLKIGTISDNTILRSIQKGENGCLTKLLNYAKSSKALYTTTVPLGKSPSITDKFKIVDDAYYFVYFELDDENGKYYPVEDVSLFQGSVSEERGANLFDYLSDDFKWNLEDDGNNTKPEDKKPTEDKKDDTTMPGNTLPKTGQTIIMIVGTIGVVVIAVIFARKSKKYNV